MTFKKIRNVLLFSPAYNIEPHLRIFLQRIEDLHLLLKKYQVLMQYLLIDDNSSDNTFGVGASAGLSFLEIRKNEANLGLAKNLEIGLQWALTTTPNLTNSVIG